jgi:hypothetical protein
VGLDEGLAFCRRQSLQQAKRGQLQASKLYKCLSLRSLRSFVAKITEEFLGQDDRMGSGFLSPFNPVNPMNPVKIQCFRLQDGLASAASMRDFGRFWPILGKASVMEGKR